MKRVKGCNGILLINGFCEFELVDTDYFIQIAEKQLEY